MARTSHDYYGLLLVRVYLRDLVYILGDVMKKPAPYSIIYWRVLGGFEWHFGYVTWVGSGELIRLGAWDGDMSGGVVVSPQDIEWKEA